MVNTCKEQREHVPSLVSEALHQEASCTERIIVSPGSIAAGRQWRPLYTRPGCRNFPVISSVGNFPRVKGLHEAFYQTVLLLGADSYQRDSQLSSIVIEANGGSNWPGGPCQGP